MREAFYSDGRGCWAVAAEPVGVPVAGGYVFPLEKIGEPVDS